MPTSPPPITVGLSAVVLAVTDEVPRVLTVHPSVQRFGPPEAPRGALKAPEDALPLGPLDAESPTLELSLRRWVREQAGLELGYVEQLYTFGDRFRDPRELRGGPRLVSVAYLALGREETMATAGSGRWRNVYAFFPWEDFRDGRPPILEGVIFPRLERWIEAAGEGEEAARRSERVDIAFGRHLPWDEERVLERYELLYEAGLVRERHVDRDEAGEPLAREDQAPWAPSRSMVLDHRRILATALGRVRGKIKYRPVVFETLPETFTLLNLQRVVEAMAGVRLHKQNFRRLVERGGLVEGTGRQDTQTGGRPAELFAFRKEVLRERPAPGVGLPVIRRKGG